MVIDIINKLNEKVKGLLQKDPITAEKAWSQAKFGKNSIKEIEDLELQCIFDKIQDSVEQGDTYCFIALNPNINYASILSSLQNNGFSIANYENPISFWIITWNQ